MTAVVIILSLIVVLTVVVLAFDIVPIVKRISAQRGIGSFETDENWFEKAESTAERWLEDGFPVVPKNADKRLKIIDIIKGERNVKAIQSWQEASVLCAVNDINSEKAVTFIQSKLSDSAVFDTDRVDFAMLAYAVLSNKQIDCQAVKPYMDKIYGLIMEKYTRKGMVPYNGDNSVCFVDTIGMICPFLVEYFLAYNSEAALKAAVDIIRQYSQNGVHKELGIPIHCYNASENTPAGLYGWGRGCGWWAVGLADTFKSLNKTEGYVEEKTLILKAFIDFSDKIIKYQRPDGGFDRNIFHFSGADSSATAMIAYSLAFAWKLTKKEKYIDCAEKSLKYIFSVTRTDGTVDYSQGDTTGPGFYSAESIVVPAAQGFALRAYRLLKER